VSELDEFYVHTVDVATHQGSSGTGPIYAANQTVAVYREPIRRLVRDETGAEVISETTLYAAPGSASAFTPGSRVTVDGATCTVITVSVLDVGALPLPAHVVVSLT